MKKKLKKKYNINYDIRFTRRNFEKNNFKYRV